MERDWLKSDSSTNAISFPFVSIIFDHIVSQSQHSLTRWKRFVAHNVYFVDAKGIKV